MGSDDMGAGEPTHQLSRAPIATTSGQANNIGSNTR
jgi:hypothetical protein